MALDEIVWQPCLGTVGDDKYNLPGATKIGGSVDTSSFTGALVYAGDATMYPALPASPTLLQINASSHWNQAIGYHNYRAIRLNNTTGGTTVPTVPYFTPDKRILASDISTLQNALINLRGAGGEQWDVTGPFTPTVQQNKIIYGYHLAEIRKILQLSGTMTIKFQGIAQTMISAEYVRQDTVYPSVPFSETTLTSDYNTAGFLGVSINPPYNMSRTRASIHFPVPYFCIAANLIAQPILNSPSITVGSTTLNGAITMNVSTSNTDDHLLSLGSGYNGYAYNNDNVILSQAAGPITNLNVPLYPPNPGHYWSFLMYNALEFSGGGLGNNAGTAGKADQFLVNQFNTSLKFNFG
jgi:hypothetical protein